MPSLADPIRIIGFDPGESTGWAIVDLRRKSFEIEALGVLNEAALTQKLEGLLVDIDVIVMENFRVRPGNAKRGSFDYSPMKTIQVIGAIKYEAKKSGIPVVLQEPAIKPMGYGFLHQPNKHLHDMDALCHLAYYCIKRKILKSIQQLPVDQTPPAT